MRSIYLRQAHHTIYTIYTVLENNLSTYLHIQGKPCESMKHTLIQYIILFCLTSTLIHHHHQPKVEISKRNQNDAFIRIFLLIHFLSPHQSSHRSSELFLNIKSSVQMKFSAGWTALKTEVHCYSFYAFLRNPPPSECKTTLQRALEWAWPLLGCRQRPAH